MDQVYCSTCGAENPAGSFRCASCGESLSQSNPNGSYQQPYQQPYNPNQFVAAPAPDAPSGGYAVLGFFFPLVGLILYLTCKDTTPLKAKSAGKGALAGHITGTVFSSLYIIFFYAFVFNL